MKKIKITNRTFLITAIVGSLFIVISVVANTLHSSWRTNVATNEAVSAVSSFYLNEMADRRAKTITNLINNNFDQMDKALLFISDQGIESQDELRDTIGRMRSLLSLDRFALVDEHNVVYTQYTTYTGGSRHEFLAEDQMKDRVISTVFNYGSSKQLCLAIATPGLTIMDRNFKACFVLIDIRDIVDLLAFDDQGRTYYGLYSRNGENLSDTELGPYVSDQNLFDALRGVVSADVLRENTDNFANDAAGSMSFDANGTEETLSYVPIQETGWEMVVLIRESMIQSQIEDISARSIDASRRQVIFTMVAAILLAALLLIMYRELSRNKLEAEKAKSSTFRNMANTDSMTGVRNKHAYYESEAAINEQIKEGTLENLGVVVCDVNGLKYVNDTYGHAAGDKLIKDACSMICDYFTHGVVFRIGGDEFLVILKGKGYDSMKEVLDKLNRKFEENITSGGVVVSMGYAVLEKGDSQLREVFERADNMMYERKKQLKAMGAQTRS